MKRLKQGGWEIIAFAITILFTYFVLTQENRVVVILLDHLSSAYALLAGLFVIYLARWRAWKPFTTAISIAGSVLLGISFPIYFMEQPTIALTLMIGTFIMVVTFLVFEKVKMLKVSDTSDFEMPLSNAISADKLVKATIVLVIVTGILAASSLVQAGLQGGQLEQNERQLQALQEQIDTLKEQTKATRELADVSRQQFESSIRPWVGIKDISLNRVHCETDQSRVRDLTKTEINNLGRPGADPQNLMQYVSRSKCFALDLSYEATVKNYGSIPAEFIKISYAVSHNSILRENATGEGTLDATKLALQSYEPITLVPDQETTVILRYTAKIENFTMLQPSESEGVFNSHPDRFVIAAQYNFLENRAHTIGVIYELDNMANFRIIRSWIPAP